MTSDLVLLPGLICDERLWRDVIAGLDARSMVADLTQDDSIGAMAARTLDAAPARFALAGLSMGGYVALEIMRQAPERVTHLALLDTSARADDEARKQTRRKGIELARGGRFIGVSRGLLASLIAPQHMGTPVAAEVQAMSERVGPVAYMRQQVAIMNRVDSRGMLGGIGIPTLVGVGESDKLTPAELAQELAAGISGAGLVTFPDSAHLPTMENPGVVVEAMRVWLGRWCHDLVVRQAHHEVYFVTGVSADLILSLSKDEVVALSQHDPVHMAHLAAWTRFGLAVEMGLGTAVKA